MDSPRKVFAEFRLATQRHGINEDWILPQAVRPKSTAVKITWKSHGGGSKRFEPGKFNAFQNRI